MMIIGMAIGGCSGSPEDLLSETSNPEQVVLQFINALKNLA
jgi:hypothetical protein